MSDTFNDASRLNLPNHYAGKVRDVYDLEDGRLVFVTSDRLSAFDRAIVAVPHKGAILNGIARHWFERTEDIAPNHVLSYPDPNVMIVRKLDMLPVEIVVRDYMTGTTGTSIWTKYKNGERRMYGHDFPEGMVKNQRLARTIITPTTKGKSDEPISAADIVARGLVDGNTWAEAERIALALFARGRELAAKQGLILVDTKYEFGLDPDGRIVVADEIHTPDSSRYWVAATYGDKFSRGEDPDGLDKEFVRRWLVARMDDPYTSPIPDITGDDLAMFSGKYRDLYRYVTGHDFTASDPSVPVETRVVKNLRAALPEQNI